MKVRRQTSWIVILLLLTLVGITLAQSRSDSTNGGPATQGVGLIRNDPDRMRDTRCFLRCSPHPHF